MKLLLSPVIQLLYPHPETNLLTDCRNKYITNPLYSLLGRSWWCSLWSIVNAAILRL